jgi:hypothetical protein
MTRTDTLIVYAAKDGTRKMLKGEAVISSVYQLFKDPEDDLLYVSYSRESVFG